MSGPVFFLVFAGLQFPQVLYVCQSLGVRALLGFFCQVCQRFQGLICHRISLGLVFQFEVWVS